MVPAASEEGAPGGAQGGSDPQSRGVYYDRWAGYTAAAAKELQQEEQKEKAAAERRVHTTQPGDFGCLLTCALYVDRALGLGQHVSSATTAKVEALRAAKAQWQNRQTQELQAKVCRCRVLGVTLAAWRCLWLTRASPLLLCPLAVWFSALGVRCQRQLSHAGRGCAGRQAGTPALGQLCPAPPLHV